jgi:hypothetical protein
MTSFSNPVLVYLRRSVLQQINEIFDYFAVVTIASATKLHHLNMVHMQGNHLCLAASRVATLPLAHPLHKIAKKKASQKPVKRHRTTLQTLLHLYDIDPKTTEKISPTPQTPKPRDQAQAVHRR